MKTTKAIRPIIASNQNYSRNQLVSRLKCGWRILRGCEDLAIELVPDFREGLNWERVVGIRNPDGSINVRRDRRGELSPYHAWVLSQLVVLWRKHKGDSDKIYDRALAAARKLSKEKFNDQLP